MKDKIIIFIVGLLFGAVISTGSIYFYTLANTNSNNNTNNQMQMGGTPPTKQQGQNGQGQPPEMPNQNNTQSNTN